MREIGEIKWFLGIRVVRDRTQRKIWLCQDSYIEKLAQKFGINQTISGPVTPISTEPLLPYKGIATESEIKDYQQKTGSVTYASTISRLDNAQASKALAEANKNPGPQHAAAVLRNLRYLVGTKYLALELGTLKDLALVLNAASDASFADDVTTRRSTEGKVFQLFGGTIDWSSKKQTTVTTSTTEAEMLSLSHTCAWLLWWGRFFNNLDLNIDQQLTVFCDNL
jgi:hypothetical protein